MSFEIGPPGCLQYYQDTYGIIQRLRFNLLTILQHTAYNIQHTNCKIYFLL